jgi:hypothetical protein
MIQKPVQRKIYITGLILLSLGILFSGPVVSMSTMLLGANWFSELNYRKRLQLFFRNPTALLLSAVFFMHLLGFLWTSNFNYGLDDLRTKVPLFVLPFIISTTPTLSKNEFRLLLAFFITGIVVSTLISMTALWHWLPVAVHDIRDISLFISHIRLSLMICLSIFALAYFFVRYPSNWLRGLIIIIGCWLIVFMGILESLTGLSILVVVSFVICIVYFSKHRPKLALTVGLITLLLFIGAVYQINSIAKGFTEVKSVSIKDLPKKSPAGHPYYNDSTFLIVENGTYVMLQACWEELRPSWEKRSKIRFDSVDAKGNPVSVTLVRYMASKGFLQKDAETFSALTDSDIHAIESGICNYKYRSLGSLNGRIYESIWEIDVYRKGMNPSGHSMTMRFEFWKTGWHVFKHNWLTGVGTGDVRDAFTKQYIADKSTLDERWRLRAHNQYLAIAVAFGALGLLLFLISLVYPLLQNKMYGNYFYLVFFMIVCISMLTEDTLETQAGVTFYAFFNSIFLFAQPKDT